MERKLLMVLALLMSGLFANAQKENSKTVYKKRVLESTEIDFITSYYGQDGDNAAVTGGIGTEELTNTTGKFIVSIPLNDDDVLTIDAGISAYTSASSSNLNPFDGNKPADPFVASSGASESDNLLSIGANYSHSSDDRNTIWSANVSFSNEYDYTSFGFGAGFTKLFNEKNTELSVRANVFMDNWKDLYPYELGGPGGDPEDGEVLPFDINNYTVTGNPNYNPVFSPLSDTRRNSYSLGFTFAQILSKRMQVSLSVDLIHQKGLLSTPYQRVYFSDIDDTFIENFHLADDVEHLPDSRFKTAIGGRMNYYINEIFSIRTFYRYYFDNWGVSSHTASVEIPVKISRKFTLYPSYRFYNQTAADYFAPYEGHVSTQQYYTSDYDLSKFNANQFGFGISYTDVFTKFHIGKWRLKSVDLKYNSYKRNTGLKASIITAGVKFVID
jgi:hypothetical protein